MDIDMNDNDNMTATNCKTRVTERDTPVTTELILNWSGVDRPSLIEWATKSVVIAWQAQQRKTGVIPGVATVDVLELGQRTRTSASPAQRAAAAIIAMSDDELAALEARIVALRAAK